VGRRSSRDAGFPCDGRSGNDTVHPVPDAAPLFLRAGEGASHDPGREVRNARDRWGSVLPRQASSRFQAWKRMRLRRPDHGFALLPESSACASPSNSSAETNGGVLKRRSGAAQHSLEARRPHEQVVHVVLVDSCGVPYVIRQAGSAITLRLLHPLVPFRYPTAPAAASLPAPASPRRSPTAPRASSAPAPSARRGRDAPAGGTSCSPACSR
jgi:hypothetical protein